MRRVDGRTVGRFFADEIAGPLGGTSTSAPRADDGWRSSSRRTVDAPAGRGGEPLEWRRAPSRTAPPPATSLAEQSWESRGGGPSTAAGGHGNGRSVALAQSVVSAGESASGVELLATEVVDHIFDVQAAGRGLVLGVGVTFGVGYGLDSPRTPITPNQRVCYWGGRWSLVVNDIDQG